MNKSTILVVEDDSNLSFVIVDHLEAIGYKVLTASNGHDALTAFQNTTIDLCLVDVMMPKMDGFTLAAEIRERNEFVPILFLTARSMEQDRLKGFEIGGDDYITKPFSISELTHRIRVFLRRSSGDAAKPEQTFSLGNLKFEDANLRILGEGIEVQLTQMEADLLKLLMQNRNKLVKREDILVSVWGENDYFKGRSLDVFLSRLRKYLKSDQSLAIKNHHGVGFTLIDSNFAG